MNCYRCGKQLWSGGKQLWSDGHLCQKCIDEMRSNQEADEQKKNGEMPLSPRKAIIAMLDGETLITERGDSVTWCEEAKAFIFTETNSYLCSFRNLSSKPKTRPMDTFQCRAWASSHESQGFMVSIKHIGEESWGDWDIPQRFKYDGKENYYNSGVISYRRAKVLPDKSGIDESTIQGFVIEEEQA